MARANHSRYSSMFQDIYNNYGQGKHKYPKSLIDAKHYINTFRTDPKYVKVICQAEGILFLEDSQEEFEDNIHV
eukprot:15338315-Ditylum_brightwellii.AAC.1